ncbi:MAG: hypothetical protein AVDCRST_MAG08-2846, partial [uncultured Acetobacteraceae bacterium]
GGGLGGGAGRPDRLRHGDRAHLFRPGAPDRPAAAAGWRTGLDPGQLDRAGRYDAGVQPWDAVGATGAGRAVVASGRPQRRRRRLPHRSGVHGRAVDRSAYPRRGLAQPSGRAEPIAGRRGVRGGRGRGGHVPRLPTRVAAARRAALGSVLGVERHFRHRAPAGPALLRRVLRDGDADPVARLDRQRHGFSDHDDPVRADLAGRSPACGTQPTGRAFVGVRPVQLGGAEEI